MYLQYIFQPKKKKFTHQANFHFFFWKQDHITQLGELSLIWIHVNNNLYIPRSDLVIVVILNVRQKDLRTK